MILRMTDEYAGWRTSSTCDGGACAEVGQGPGTVAVRDTQDRSGPVLWFGTGAWEAFTGRMKRGGGLPWAAMTENADPLFRK